MDETLLRLVENPAALRKVCRVCDSREGDLDAEGKPLQFKEGEDGVLCSDCLEVFACVDRWV
jgi:hypothetical protein